MSLDPTQSARIELLRLLAARLERLSVDSIWARRASGLRGSVIKALEAIDSGAALTADHLDLLIEQSFQILRNAAREIPDAEARWRNLSSDQEKH
ncbi:MAG TPA: hypothetical protein VGK00_09485 [Anaerolineales bacterium]